MTDTATRTEKKLSVIPKGHWRNAWWPRGPLWRAYVTFESKDQEVAGCFICHKQHAHEMDAEHVARMELQGLGLLGRLHLRYLGPVFFPAPTDT